MADFSMKRNGSGYYDETPYKALMGMAKPGEIWLTSQGKEYLVLKNHGQMSTVLALMDTSRDSDNVPVISRQMKYTNPAMVQYMFNANFGEYVKSIPDSDLQHILDAVAKKLGFTNERSQDKPKSPEEEVTAAVYKQMYDELLAKVLLRG